MAQQQVKGGDSTVAQQPPPITVEQVAILLKRWQEDGAWGNVHIHFQDGKVTTIEENRTWKAAHLEQKAQGSA